MRRVSLARVRDALRSLARRPGWLILLLIGLATAITLLLVGTLNMADGAANAALNLGTDFLGAIITVAIIGPIIRYVQEGTVREHGRLDYDWFIAQVDGATVHVQILTTFSNLLDQPSTDRFLRVLAGALARSARVQILLLNPGSLAAEQRQQELATPSLRANVQREIMRNVRRLTQFAASLGEGDRPRFEVRLYNASASITLYRWDDRALVSFLPIGRFSEHGAQLEVTMRSPLGEFVEQRFQELWEHVTTVDMSRFVQLHLTLLEDEQTARILYARYVTHDNVRYVVHTEVLAVMARRPVSLRIYCDGDPSQLYDLDIVDNRQPVLHDALSNAFLEKYDDHAHTFVRLLPA
jgi:hypothetical protein